MACGLPVVVSRIPGNVDVIEHEQNGLLCTVEAPAALAQAIASLLDQTELLERLGRAARRTVEDLYSLNPVA